MPAPAYYRAPVRLRRPVRVTRTPWLAGPLVAAGAARPRGLRRLGYRLAKRAFFALHQDLGVAAAGEIEVVGAGSPFRLAVDGANTAFIRLAQIEAEPGYEPELGAVFDRVAGEARVVFDVGANWGYFGVLFATHPDFDGVVHAFEPAPATGRDLEAVAAAPALAGRIVRHPFGLSNADGAVPFAAGRHSALASVEAAAAGAATVEVRRLDGLGLPAPDIVKIDVEGHELAVLEGAEATLAAARPVVVVESLYDADPARCLAPLRFLDERGYALFRPLWETAVADHRVLTTEVPDTDADGRVTLALVPCPPAERLATPAHVNLVAWPAERRDALESRFEPVPSERTPA